jgi:hypothetical protein
MKPRSDPQVAPWLEKRDVEACRRIVEQVDVILQS